MTVASESESRINLNYIARASAEPINLELSKNAGTQRENSNYGVLRVYLLQRARAHIIAIAKAPRPHSSVSRITQCAYSRDIARDVCPSRHCCKVAITAPRSLPLFLVCARARRGRVKKESGAAAINSEVADTNSLRILMIWRKKVGVFLALLAAEGGLSFWNDNSILWPELINALMNISPWCRVTGYVCIKNISCNYIRLRSDCRAW